MLGIFCSKIARKLTKLRLQFAACSHRASWWEEDVCLGQHPIEHAASSSSSRRAPPVFHLCTGARVTKTRSPLAALAQQAPVVALWPLGHGWMSRRSRTYRILIRYAANSQCRSKLRGTLAVPMLATGRARESVFRS
jgi:hypothetical protein